MIVVVQMRGIAMADKDLMFEVVKSMYRFLFLDSCLTRAETLVSRGIGVRTGSIEVN